MIYLTRISYECVFCVSVVLYTTGKSISQLYNCLSDFKGVKDNLDKIYS